MGRKKKLSTVTLSIQDLMTQPRRLAGLPMMNKMAGYRVLLSVIGRLQGLWSIAKMPGADKNGQLYLQFETDDFEVVKEKRGVYNEGDILFRLKLSDIVPDNHYKEAREALASMTRIKCYIPDKSNPGYYRTSTLMDIYGEAEKGKNGLEFVGTDFDVVVSNYVAENILDINLFDNYTRFLGYTACRLKSGFSYPLYIYLSEEWRYRGSQFSIPIKNLRERLGFVKDIDDPERETRYMAWSLFCQKVLDQAKKELDDLAKTGGADFTFEYQGLLDGEPLPKYKRPDAVMFTITPTEVGEQLQAENDYIIGKTTLRKILSGFFKLSSSQIIGLMNRVTPAMMPEFEQKIKNLKSEIESKRKSEIKNISAWSYTAVNGIIRELEECFGTRRVVDVEAEEVKTEESSCRDSEVFDNDEEF